jgi:hypothetical protein
MSLISLTPSERVASLGCLGYTEREARFLCTAALHSGYFLRRQYRDFLAQGDGGAVAQLIEKALAQKHVQPFTFHYKTQIYHLGARPFYAALGQSDNRNRRQHEPITIKSKLMGLDFVLAHGDKQFLATEQEKVDYFSQTLSSDRAALPAQVYRSVHNGGVTPRYFVERYPIFLSTTPTADHSLSTPVVSFGFVDEGTVTLSGFETFLTRYRELFASLARFVVVYIAENAARCQKARGVFERVIVGSDSGALDLNIRRLLEHFEARRLYENKEFATFDRAKLIRLRNEQQEFSGPEYDAHYALWQRGGSTAILEKLRPNRSQPGQLSGTFSACVLEHSYDFFGHVNGF